MYEAHLGDSSIKFSKETIIYSLLSLIVFGYGFTPFLNKDLNSFFEVLLGIYFFYLFISNENNFRKDKMVKIFILLMLTQIATWLSVKFSHPELATNLPKIDRLGKLCLFIPIAWHLSGNKKRMFYFLIFALLGFFLAIFLKNDMVLQIQQGLNGYRLDFGIRNAQHPSMVFGMILLFSLVGCLFVSNKILKFIVFPSLIFICFFGLGFTQTRQSFVGLAAAFAIVLFVSLIFKIISFKKFLFCVATISLIFISLVKFSHLDARFHSTNSFFASLKNPTFASLNNLSLDEKLSFYISNIPDTGTGIRVKTWLNAVPWILEKPFLGWGSDARSTSIKQSKFLSEFIKKNFGHLHNFHIEMILSYGVVGFFILCGIYVWLIWSSFTLKDTSKYNRFIFILAVAFSVYWFTINNFESMNSFWTGVFVNNAICGFIYSSYLYKNRNSEINEYSNSCEIP